MLDDNVFTNEYEVCAFCGGTHVNDKYCPVQLALKKSKTAWICDILKRKMGRIMGMFQTLNFLYYEINMKGKCVMCQESLDDDLDVVYGLYEKIDGEEIMFCSRFCRTMYLSNSKFEEHRSWEKKC